MSAPQQHRQTTYRRPDDVGPALPLVPPFAEATWPTMRTVRAAVRGCRPRQALTKNLLVFTAPAMGGHLLNDAGLLPGVLVAMVAFCAVSSAVYLANDVRDVESDRCHPVKCRRAIASGELSIPCALVLASALTAGGLLLAVWWSSSLTIVLTAYLAIQVAYSAHFKHVPGVDLFSVTSGFVLRVIAGGVATGVEVSMPFLVVVGSAALFMVAGKRYSEMRTLGASAGTRRSLAGYSLRWLRRVWVLAAATASIGYAVATTGLAPFGTASFVFSMASVPLFVAGVVRYAAHVRAGDAGCPEAVIFSDRVLQALGALWLMPLSAAIVLA